MGGDHLQELTQRNFYTFERFTGFESNLYTSWCLGGVDFLASDQLVHLEQSCAYDPITASSSPASQVTMDDDWKPGNPNNHMKLQESMSISKADIHQQEPWCGTNHTAKGCYASPSTLSHSHRRFEANHDVAAKPKRNNQARKDNEHDNKKKRKTETKSNLQLLNDKKIGKEKMGNRIATLQRLVSPFGKADTASVLSECIEYIRFLHEQVSVLSTVCSTTNVAEMEHFQNLDEFFDDKRALDPDSKTGLRSRGLCIVPVSSALCLANDLPRTTASHDSESSNLQM